MERNARLLAIAFWLGCVVFIVVHSVGTTRAMPSPVFRQPAQTDLAWMKPRQN